MDKATTYAAMYKGKPVRVTIPDERLYCDGCGRELRPSDAYPGDEDGGPYCLGCELRSAQANGREE